MNDQELEQHLSHIATQWTMLEQAHRGQADEATRARQALMRRYCGAVYRYLLGAVRDIDVAGELTQEFALRFMQGRFQNADREQGRFRSYVKASLFRLVGDWRRNKFKGPRAVSLEAEDELAGADENARADQEFRDSWRQELLSRAWKALEQVQQEARQPYHDVLRFRVDHPDLPSAQMAEQLGARLGRPLTAAG